MGEHGVLRGAEGTRGVQEGPECRGEHGVLRGAEGTIGMQEVLEFRGEQKGNAEGCTA